MSMTIPGWTRQQWVDYTGLWATCAFGFCAWLSPAGANIALVLLALGFFFSPAARRAFRRDPLCLLFLGFAAYAVLSAIAATVEFPESGRLQYRDTSNWLKLFAFWPVAWWLRGDPKRIDALLLLALSGLLVGMLRHADWSALLRLEVGARTGFQQKIIFSGLVSGTSLLGLLLLAPRIIRRNRVSLNPPLASPGVVRGMLIFLWLSALYLLGYMLISSFSRGAWLAFALSASVTLAWRFLIPLLCGSIPWKSALPWIMLTLAGLGVFGAINADRIKARVGAERGVYSSVLQGEQAELPRTSLGFRVNVQKFAVDKWLERPLLGWGTGTVEHLLAHSNQQQLLHPSHKGGVDWMDHFHNTYLEILVRFGLVGAALLTAGLVLLLRAVLRAWQGGLIPQDYFLFYGGSFGLLAIWSLFDFRALHGDWRAYWVILAGAAYSVPLHSLQPRLSDQEPP